MSRFIITCEEAGILSDRKEYGELSGKDRFKLKTHMAYCLKCRAYEKMNRRLSRSIKNANWVQLSEDKKQEIKDKIQKNWG